MAGTVVIPYKPSDKQKLFHLSIANEVLYGGAAGGGKSVAIVLDGLKRCLAYPGFRAYMFRRTYRELEDTLITEARRWYPQEIASYNIGRHEMSIANGSKVFFRHCQSVANMYDYAGAEMHGLYIDELTSFEQQIYEFLKTRLRARLELGITPIIRCASNPGNIGHGWVKQYFVDAGPYGSMIPHVVKSEVKGLRRTFTTQYIPALATDNPHITDDYIFELEQKPDALRRALLLGDWDAFEGQVFKEWTDDPEHYQDRLHTHVIKPFQIPVNWPRVMSFDHGYTKPFSVGWWAVGPMGELYRYREWYGCVPGRANKGIELSPRQIAEGIVEREREEALDNITVDRIADPAIFERSRGDSVAQQMEPTESRTGIYFRKGDNSRIAGKMQLHERLRFGQDGRPLLYVFDTCRDFIRTIPTLPYDQTKTEDVDSDSEDHIYDETRYALMSRPAPVRQIVTIAPKPFDPFSPPKRRFA